MIINLVIETKSSDVNVLRHIAVLAKSLEKSLSKAKVTFSQEKPSLMNPTKRKSGKKNVQSRF